MLMDRGPNQRRDGSKRNPEYKETKDMLDRNKKLANTSQLTDNKRKKRRTVQRRGAAHNAIIKQKDIVGQNTTYRV